MNDIQRPSKEQIKAVTDGLRWRIHKTDSENSNHEVMQQALDLIEQLSTHEPPAEPTPEEVCEYAYRLKMWRRGDGWLPIQLAEIMRKQIETAWSLRAAQPPSPDAARYRWLRSHIAPSILSRIWGHHIDELVDSRPEALDAEIDRRLGITKESAP